MRRALVRVDGHVQGVGFRWWVARHADRLGLVGSAVNRPDGSVAVDVQGEPDAVDTLVRLVVAPPAGERRPGHVTDTEVTDAHPDPRVVSFRTG